MSAHSGRWRGQTKLNALVAGVGVVLLAVAAISASVFLSACGGGEPTVVSRHIGAATGGTISVRDNVSLTIGPGALAADTTVTIRRASKENRAPIDLEGGQSVGAAFKVDLGAAKLVKPVELEIAYDAKLLPEGSPESAVFLTFYDEEADRWVPVEGRVDQERKVAIVETDHLSWWNPFSWNWAAWIAVLDKVLQGNLVDLLDAVALLTNDCPQAGPTVSVDSSRANDVVQGCVERDDPVQPALRVVNPKSFFYEVGPTSGGNGYPPHQVLGPGESLAFTADTSDPTPLIVSAEITQKSGVYLIVHLIVEMLPGLDQFGIQTQQIACITQRIADVSYVASAAQALLVEHDGAAAAEQLAQMLTNADAMRRFITAADDCGYGAAPTWSLEGIRQIGAATSTILSATDFVANYFLNYHSEVAFNWIQPATPTPAPTPQPRITTVITFTPSNIDGSGAQPGDCWTSSVATGGRQGSFRCFLGNGIHDPCFGEGGQSIYVLCPGDPTIDSDDVVLWADYSNFRAFGSGSNPWFFLTFDGLTCGTLTGTGIETPGGYAFHICSSLACLDPEQLGELWRFDCYDTNGAKSTHDVKTIWF